MSTKEATTPVKMELDLGDGRKCCSSPGDPSSKPIIGSPVGQNDLLDLAGRIVREGFNIKRSKGGALLEVVAAGHAAHSHDDFLYRAVQKFVSSSPDPESSHKVREHWIAQGE